MPTAAQTLPSSREQIKLSYAPLVKQAAAAVVNIYTSRIVRQREMGLLFNDPIFQQFFGPMMQPGLSRERMENSLGSGVILRPDGLIVTSAHVIEGADEIRVVLSDRREFAAKLTAIDKQTDLAVMKIDVKTEQLPFLQLADSDAAEVGDLVIAIGNPFGVGQTVTSGILSAVARTGVGINDLNYFLQTDAAINPGNSGGALVGMDGRLIGINAAIFSQSGGSLGIGFAVPSNMVRAVIGAVAEGKDHVVRPWLGFAGQDVTQELASSLGQTRPTGVIVNKLHPQSPAAKAGLRLGDVVISLNGRDIEDMQALRFRAATMAVGAPVMLGISRKGAKQDIAFNFIAPPEDPPRHETLLKGRNPLDGAKIVNISPAVIEELELHDAAENGVAVAAVQPRSPAAGIGLQRGDQIAAINGTEIETVADAKEALEQTRAGWDIQVRRGGRLLRVMVGR